MNMYNLRIGLRNFVDYCRLASTTPLSQSGKEQFWRLKRYFMQITGGIVQNGPFAGLMLTEAEAGSMLLPKLIGCYEKELHPAIEQISQSNYDIILDIGCAEGYYACGFALRTHDSNTHVIAFDINPDAIRITQKVAELNGLTHRVECRSICNHDTFDIIRGKKALIFCDIEGAELELLDPSKAESLLECDILVEIHDGPTGTLIHDTLVKRFQETHKWHTLPFIGRSSADLYNLKWYIPNTWHSYAMNEHRKLGLQWLFFFKRNSSP